MINNSNVNYASLWFGITNFVKHLLDLFSVMFRYFHCVFMSRRVIFMTCHNDIYIFI